MTYRFDEEKMVTDVGMSVASAPITALVAGATVAERRRKTPSRAKSSFKKNEPFKATLSLYPVAFTYAIKENKSLYAVFIPTLDIILQECIIMHASAEKIPLTYRVLTFPGNRAEPP